jgi:hypothetical protein
VRLLGCDPTDLAAWVRGDAPVPAAIVALLHLLIEGTISTADVGSAKVVARSRPSPGHWQCMSCRLKRRCTLKRHLPVTGKCPIYQSVHR